MQDLRDGYFRSDNTQQRAADTTALPPPVFIGFGDAFTKGGWRVIGHARVDPFPVPRFRASFGLKPGTYHDWKIYDGIVVRAIGDLLPEFRSLEFLCGWSPQAIELRIRTGENPYDRIC